MKTEGKRNLLRQPDEIRLMTGSAQTEQETARCSCFQSR